MVTPKILFLLRRKEKYDVTAYSSPGVASGMYNSAKYVVDALVRHGIEANIEIVVDSNSIDAMCHKHKPTHVICEGIWVPPYKFEQLKKIRPGITWIVRVHSDMPFLAGEGMAMTWLPEYLKLGVTVSGNSHRMNGELKAAFGHLTGLDCAELTRRIPFLPNCYTLAEQPQKTSYEPVEPGYLNVGCFGAIRPLKNQLIQAVAAIKAANELGLKLKFHINGSRKEMHGENVSKNLHALFAAQEGRHELIEHGWLDLPEFIELLATKIDVSMQVSLSETFNLVIADSINAGTPIVVSPEIDWVYCGNFAEPTSSDEIAERVQEAWRNRNALVDVNRHMLTNLAQQNDGIWLEYFTGSNPYPKPCGPCECPGPEHTCQPCGCDPHYPHTCAPHNYNAVKVVAIVAVAALVAALLMI